MLHYKWIAGIILIIAACIGIYFWGEWEKARFDASLPTPPPAMEPAAETAPREKPPRGTPVSNHAYRTYSATEPPDRIDFTPDEQRRLNEFVTYALSIGMPPEEIDQGVLNLFTKGMNPEETVQFLETRRLYIPAILKQIDDARALQYVLTIYGTDTVTRDITVPIAERLLTTDPGNLAAGFHLAEMHLVTALASATNEAVSFVHLGGMSMVIGRATAAGRAAAAEVYRSLLPYNPDSPELLKRLGQVLWEDKPVEAIRYLKQANRVGSANSDFRLGFAYQRVGDYDTALFHLRRFAELPAAHPVTQQRAWHHIARIEEGDPIILPIALESGSAAPEAVQGASDAASVQPQHTSSSAAPHGDVDDRDSRTPQHVEDGSDAAADAARAEFEKMRAQAQQELQKFLQGYTADDRVADEMKTLTNRYDPGRLSRAIETLSEHGAEEGLRRLKQRDPELAEQLEKQMKRGRK